MQKKLLKQIQIRLSLNRQDQNQIVIILAVSRRIVQRAQPSYEETSQRWQALGNNVSDLTGVRIKPVTSCAYSDVFGFL